MVCSLFGVHWVMLRYVVEILASWAGKFNRQNLGALEYDPLLSYVGYLEGKE